MMMMMERNGKRLEISLDQALVGIGEFSWAQTVQTAACATAWGVAGLQTIMILLSTLGAAQPMDYIHCTKHGNEDVCQRVLNSPDVRIEEVCRLPRQSWDWSTSKGFSLVTEFDLICDRAWITLVPATCLFIGALFGSIACYAMEERVSRRRMLSTGFLVAGITGCMAATAPFVWTLCACLLALGAGTSAIMIASFLLTTDVCGRSWKAYAGVFLHAGFSLGACMGAILIYVIPLWRWTTLIGALFPLLCTLSAWSLVLESPEWLLMNGRKGEAMAILAAIAFSNRSRPIECSLADPTDFLANPYTNMEDIWHSPRLRRRAVVLSAVWGIATLVYFLLIMILDTLGDQSGVEGDGSTLEIAIAGFAYELPGVAAAALLAERLGRRSTVVSGLLLAALTLGSACFPRASGIQRGLAACSRFGLAMAFAALFISTYESFPIAVQRPGMVAVSYAARLGSIFSPIIAFVLIFSCKSTSVPLIILATLCLFAGILAIMLPETLGIPICDTIHDFNNQVITTAKRNRFSWSNVHRKFRSLQEFALRRQYHSPSSPRKLVQEGSSSSV